MPSVLFVCLGNICRSPLAEGVFRETVRQAGYEAEYDIDSAGTGSWHEGNPPDPRSIAIASSHGIDISSQRARQVTASDFSNFDLILAMDFDNLATLKRLRTLHKGTEPRLFLETEGLSVPDPYYGGADGFEKVYQMIRNGSLDLLADIERRRTS